MTDDFDITMACLDAIEQEVRRARAVLRQEALPEPCDAEVWSTDYYPAGHIDPYWIRCTKVAPHDQHQDSNTGLSWPDRPGTPAQDAHTPRTAPRTRSGGTESGDEPFVAASALGDKLRALGVRFQRGVSNSDPANDEDVELSGHHFWVTVQGIEALAAEVDRMAQTLDGALTSAAVFKEDRDRLKAILQDTAQVLDDILGDTQAGMAIEDESETHLRTAQRRGGALDKIGDRILALTDRHRVLELDGASSEAGGNGEVGV